MVDSATVIALVVSLVALFVSFLQLIGQLFGTAEGYRRCRRPFIGPWYALTKSHWLWSEFRYEIFYTTPDILLVDNSASSGITKAEHLWRLNSPHFNGRSKRVQARKDPTFLTVHGEEALKLNNLRWKERIPRICKNLLKGIKRHVCLPFHSSDIEEDEEDRGETAELVVSWIQLLRELHDLYPQRPSDPSAHETAVVVRHRRYSWDLIPQGVTRPLATARVSDVVILGLRLGMEWREIKPRDSKMYADGNGYSIRSLDVPAAGCILAFEKSKLHSTGEHSPDPEATGYPLYIPSSTVDAMACNVLSTCPRLMGRQKETTDPGNEKSTMKPDKTAKPIRFFMVDKERIVQVWVLLSFLDVPDEIWNKGSALDLPAIAPERQLIDWLRPWRRTAFNDLIFLITPFLPIEGVPTIKVLFNGFCGMQALSVFNHFEARIALLTRIEKRCRPIVDSKYLSQLDSNEKEKILSQLSPDERDLINVYEDFRSLERDWAGDLYMKVYGSPAAVGYGRAGEGLNQKRRLELIEFCKEKHENTTKYFEGLAASYGLSFKQLLNAHFVITAKASMEMQRDWDTGQQFRNDKEWRKLYPGETPYTERSHRALWDLCFRELFAIGWKYVDCVERWDLCTHLKDTFGCELSPTKVEAIWWHLMLRGIVQGMVVIFENGRVVPSYVYGDNTTVYFT
ncbi:uncharacterized protein LY89DRAFT_786072 [Mollisia scopiformis]|uniref:Uncharacterized protein n=1 Tax=Mollisia scopiformis TaxID=149040 RepID=A0A194WVA9_MOLSC|nr:uncharacterized protein LY89DRAFT_786072 [Mollisia scopiformis]KUJ11905.1 hypothetical protein LY89DRAFT_786072 [Mollisia scopiformis]